MSPWWRVGLWPTRGTKPPSAADPDYPVLASSFGPCGAELFCFSHRLLWAAVPIDSIRFPNFPTPDLAKLSQEGTWLLFERVILKSR